MRIGKLFTFDAAHFLPDYAGKCGRMHGHTYQLEVILDGKINEDGMVEDFSYLSQFVKKYILDEVDHQVLNNVVAFRPTAELLAIYFGELLSHLDKRVVAVKLWETPTSYAEWRSDGSDERL